MTLPILLTISWNPPWMELGTPFWLPWVCSFWANWPSPPWRFVLFWRRRGRADGRTIWRPPRDRLRLWKSNFYAFVLEKKLVLSIFRNYWDAFETFLSISYSNFVRYDQIWLDMLQKTYRKYMYVACEWQFITKIKTKKNIYIYISEIFK